MRRRRSRPDVRSMPSRPRTGHGRGRLATASSLFRWSGRSPGCDRRLRAVRPDRSRAARSRWRSLLPPGCPQAAGHRRSCSRPIPIRRVRLGPGRHAGACGERPSPEVPSHPPRSRWSARSVRPPPARRSWNPSRRSSSLPSRREGRWQRSPRAGDRRMRRNASWGALRGRAGRTASPRRICARTWGGRPPALAALHCARGNPRSRRAHPAAALRVRTRGRRGRCLASPYLAGSSRPHGRNPAGKPGTKDTGRSNRRPPPRLRTLVDRPTG